MVKLKSNNLSNITAGQNNLEQFSYRRLEIQFYYILTCLIKHVNQGLRDSYMVQVKTNPNIQCCILAYSNFE